MLIALGGNAMTSPDGRARPEDQRAAIALAMEAVAGIVAAGDQVVLTHGNGPQVGNLLVKNEIAASVVPPVPLDWCGAQTQGTIGFLIMNALEASLAARGVTTSQAGRAGRPGRWCDADDPHFADPSKPIGRYLPADEAATHDRARPDLEGPRRAKGWRRVVASPEPVEVPRRRGGARRCSTPGTRGLRRRRRDPGRRGTRRARCSGVEAVIDKDLTAALLGRQLGADTLLIATDVEAVMTGCGTAAGSGRSARSAWPSCARSRRAASSAAAAWGPKVEAACRFADGGGAGDHHRTWPPSTRRWPAGRHRRRGIRRLSA